MTIGVLFAAHFSLALLTFFIILKFKRCSEIRLNQNELERTPCTYPKYRGIPYVGLHIMYTMRVFIYYNSLIVLLHV